MLKRIINYLKSNKVDCFTLSHNTRKLAFTLAETLIVMGIIGIVAALTLPNLNSSTGEKEKVAKVKKIYQNLEDALGRAQAVYGPYNEWCNKKTYSDCYKEQGERITEFMKLSKNFGICASNDCARDVKPLRSDDDEWEGPCGNDAYCVILADGTLVGFKGTIGVDIDGLFKGANTEGKDIFYFVINQDTGELNPCRNDKSCFLNGSNCTGWVIENGNMDYLKADSNGNCNNSDVTLNETVTSCK